MPGMATGAHLGWPGADSDCEGLQLDVEGHHEVAGCVTEDVRVRRAHVDGIAGEDIAQLEAVDDAQAPQGHLLVDFDQEGLPAKLAGENEGVTATKRLAVSKRATCGKGCRQYVGRDAGTP